MYNIVQDRNLGNHSGAVQISIGSTPTFLCFGGLLVLISTVLLVLFGRVVAARVALRCARRVGLGAGGRGAALHLWVLPLLL